jgi:hypothetical protein
MVPASLNLNTSGDDKNCEVLLLLIKLAFRREK